MDAHEAHAEAIHSNNRLLKGTYEDGYKAGREAGMREAVSIIRREQTEMTDPVFWATAILSAIGGGK